VVLRASAVGAGVLVLGAVTFFCWEAAKKGLFLAFSRHVFGQLDLAKSLLTPYQLQRRLLTLFREGAQDPEKADDVKVGKDPLHLLLVSANLKDGDQYYSEEEDPLIQGLLAAMAIPGIFPSVRPKDTDIDLIDGATVRANPLPALIRWLAKHPREAEALKRDAPSIHVVYSVPIEPYAPKRGQRQEPIDIVEAVSVARELSQRRDTRQEVQQSNFMADLVRTVESIRQERGPGPVCEFTADEIAPPRDIQFGNYWDPQPQEILAAAASGCKATLERLYPTEIQSLCEGLGTTIPCAKLLAAVAAERQPFFYPDAPGVPEICRECPRVLDYKPPANPSAPPPGITRSFGTKMADGKPDLSAFRHLHDDNPRIVFVAAGGVFRGAFHIGTIAALGACEIKPQLIVGASVGALMGGALAAISVQEDPQKALKLLHQLTTVFLHVDQKVALTAQLKNAAKQLGVRSREIALSPSEVRRMVLAGSQADAGYAAAGAPPALIDAISKLFLIPHRRTTSIASEFVAGHFSKAVNRFLLEVRRETLPSLDIEHALMGISLLEDTARKLLGQEAGISLDVVQPYQIGKTKVSFFATTSYVNQRMSLLLGRDFLTEDASYDFLKAALSSSAFPAVFSPRTEAEVVPGRGKTDVFFADGGMFDNLPFLPAIEVLNAMQVSGRREPLQPDTDPTPAQIDEVLQALRRRHDRRDISIAAALDADPGPLREKLDTMMKVKNRAGSLQKNGKIESFLKSSRKIHAQVGMILLTERIALRKWLKGLRTTEERVWNLKLLDGIVDAAILKIVPADDEHINPTFAFCCATGMKADKVRTSIADGCYQTLVQIRKHAGEPDYTALPATLEDRDSAKAGESDCAWFRRNGQPLPCPFAQNADDQVGAVRKACAGDKKHKPVSQPIGLRLLTALQALFK
jgi:predicted acylesterase/phospholipase RssA